MVVLERITNSGVAKGGRGAAAPGRHLEESAKIDKYCGVWGRGGAPKSYKGNGAPPPLCH